MQKEDKMTKTSFGEYFDAQRDRMRKDMQNKNAQQNIEWMEDYEKRQVIGKNFPDEVWFQKRADEEMKINENIIRNYGREG